MSLWLALSIQSLLIALNGGVPWDNTYPLNKPHTYSAASQNKTVHYELTLSHGLESPDCYQRPIVLINGQFPGPPLRAPKNGRMIVTVKNDLFYEGATLHWHGLHQNGTLQYDGVAFGTQMPILPGDSYTYDLDMAGNSPGTYWYHAHYQLQSQTVKGALIIEDEEVPVLERNDTLSIMPISPDLLPVDYDEERILLLSDWFHQSDEEQLIGLMGSPFRWIGDPQSMMINGKGRYDCSLAPGTPCDVKQCEYEKISVTYGMTYRLRIIGASSLSYLYFAIAGHNLTVFEVDGILVEPVEVDHLEVNSGQRFSVLLRADQPPSNYRISTEVRWRKAGPTGIAFLSYEEALAEPIVNPSLHSGPVTSNGVFLKGTANAEAGFPDGIPVFPPWKNNTPASELEWLMDRLIPLKPIPPPAATREIILTGTQMRLPDPVLGTAANRTKWVINGYAYKPPSEMSLLYAAMKGQSFMQSVLDEDETTPLIFHLERGEVVDVVLQNTVALNGVCEQHPWHLHGHSFWSLGGGPGNYSTLTLKQRAKYLNTDHPIQRDSTTLFPYEAAFFQQPGVAGTPCGFQVLRFVADNPGVWNMHCHIPAHMHMGMQLFFAEAIDELPALVDPHTEYLAQVMQSQASSFVPSFWYAVAILLSIFVVF